MEKVLTELNVKELSGPKGLVIFFYPHAHSEGCSIEVAAYNKKLTDFQQLGYNVVGISNDDTQKNEDFSCDLDVKFPLISDPEQKIISQYKVWGPKERDGRKYEGVIRSTFVLNPQGETIIEMRNVEPNKHIDTLLNELKTK